MTTHNTTINGPADFMRMLANDYYINPEIARALLAGADMVDAGADDAGWARFAELVARKNAIVERVWLKRTIHDPNGDVETIIEGLDDHVFTSAVEVCETFAVGVTVCDDTIVEDIICADFSRADFHGPIEIVFVSSASDDAEQVAADRAAAFDARKL